MSAWAQFAAAWSDDMLASDLGERLTCTEVEALADLFIDNGAEEIAQMWLQMHAYGDEEGDLHWQTFIDWMPNPGHHPGQPKEHIVYEAGEYRGMTVEIYNPTEGEWHWSFYDASSDDPETAVARDHEESRELAEAELKSYIDGYVGEER
jgi:hypothetical protein